jgi:pimeloyl-ACP methyl ester carboxylesterase
MSAVLFKPNEELMASTRSLVHSHLADISKLLVENHSPDFNEHFHMEMIVGDLLALYPFLAPKEGEEVKVPVKIGDAWHEITYQTERIELTPSWMGSPLVAYGLKPSTNVENAPPILLFKGTTFPADEGATLSILTDINPGASVGNYAFHFGREKIQQWLSKNTSNQKAVICGKSLGGALSWRTAMTFPEHVSKVMAYGPPGFAFSEKKQLHQAKENYPDMEINFFCQKNDLVPFSDHAALEGDVNYYQVNSPKNSKNPLMAHAAMLSLHDQSKMKKMTQEKIFSPWKRLAVTAMRYFASLFFPLILLGHVIKTVIEKSLHHFQEGIKRLEQRQLESQPAAAAEPLNRDIHHPPLIEL